jgi:PIN domain nuclease of toxin-antitoxin system
MKLLLDTHTFLWFIAGSPHLSADAAFDDYAVTRLW